MVIHSSTKRQAPDTLDSRSPGLKLPCRRSHNTLASAYTSVTGTFNSPNTGGGKGDKQGAIKGDSFCGAVDVVGVGVSSGGTPVPTSLPYPPSARSTGYLKICHGRTLHHGKWQKLQMSGFTSLFFIVTNSMKALKMVHIKIYIYIFKRIVLESCQIHE